MKDTKTVQEESGLDPEHWQPIDSAPIIPGQTNRPGQEGSPGFFQGSIPYAAQHDSTFVDTAYRSPTAPQLALMPLSPSGQPGINSSGNNQATEALNKALPGVIKNGATFPATLDSVKNSKTSAKVSITATNQDGSRGLVGALNPAQSGFISSGSTPFSIAPSPFSFVATATTIDLIWTTPPVLRGDGTTLVLPSGSLLVSGLTAGTNYFFYPYLNDLALPGAVDYKVVSWLAYTGGVGTPAIAYLAASAVLGQQSNLQHFIGLVATALEFATPASGSSGGSGGGNGGSGGGKGNSFD